MLWGRVAWGSLFINQKQVIQDQVNQTQLSFFPSEVLKVVDQLFYTEKTVNLTYGNMRRQSARPVTLLPPTWASNFLYGGSTLRICAQGLGRWAHHTLSTGEVTCLNYRLTNLNFEFPFLSISSTWVLHLRSDAIATLKYLYSSLGLKLCYVKCIETTAGLTSEWQSYIYFCPKTSFIFPRNSLKKVGLIRYKTLQTIHSQRSSPGWTFKSLSCR